MEFISLIWTEAVIRPMTNSLVFLYAVLFANFGIAIICFTFIIRLATFPLTVKQARMTKQMGLMQPKLQEIQKKYKGDRQAISRETMKLYKTQGISPFGCLGPFALQFPIFIGMFFAIRDTLATTPEALVGLGPKLYSALPLVDSAIPVSDSFLWLNLGSPDPSPLIMPVLVGLSTFVLSKMSMASKNADPRQASMAKTMTFMMPIFLAFITFSFPSGLALYWISSNLVGIIIQYFTSGWGGLFPKKEVTSDSKTLEKELISNGQDNERGDFSENSGGSDGARHQRAKRSSKRSSGRRN